MGFEAIPVFIFVNMCALVMRDLIFTSYSSTVCIDKIKLPESVAPKTFYAMERTQTNESITPSRAYIELFLCVDLVLCHYALQCHVFRCKDVTREKYKTCPPLGV